ncbi:MAG TPA: hypothetical protein VND93_29555 [Myxococcales bacterium]|nr:hypothetical protein [Myxococcales bacterium]
MPLELPDLDDRTYADLVEEARRLIPSFDPLWTDHNPSDPGITVVELFAYLSELLLYRLNRVTEANQNKFLKLLQTPDWKATPGDLNGDTRQAVLSVRQQWRAVSPADYERIALGDFNDWLAAMQRADAANDAGALKEWWDLTHLDKADPANLPSKVPPVRRARCISGQNLERDQDPLRLLPDPAHVSLIAVPAPTEALPAVDPLRPPPALTAAVWGFLDERRVLTTRHHVVGAIHAPVSAELVVCGTADAVAAGGLAARIAERLDAFLDPISGGPDGEGWPFGRDVYVSELVEQMEGVQGVDYVTDVMLSSACAAGDVRCVAAPARWHAEGDLIGLELKGHHLPEAGIAAAGVVVAPNAAFLEVKVTAQVNPAGEDVAAVKRKVKSAVRAFFHPLHGGPGPTTASDRQILIADLRDALDDIPVFVQTLQVAVDPSRLLRQGETVTGFVVRAGEVVNWRTVVNA